jgi:hypothetical protein
MAQRLAVLACLLIAPSLAAAQTITISESADQEIPPIFNQAECTNQTVDTIALSWTLTTAQAVDLYVSNTASCPQPSNNTNSNAHTASFATNLTTTIFNGGKTAADLINLAQISCQSSGSSLFICAFPTGTNTTPVATATIQLDLSTPPAPVANNATPGDAALTVSWSQGQGTAGANQTGTPNSFNIYYAVSGSDLTTAPHISVTGGSTTSGRITGLTNGTAYDVQVTALTIGSNESPRSNTVHGTPIPVDDFWRLYKSDGGRETGGCATGGAGMLALLAVPLALRASRRRS